MTGAYSWGRIGRMTDRPNPDSLRPGDVVGPWHIEGYAGRGAYGVVFRARRAGHPSSRPVALKVAQCADDPRFVREVGLLGGVQHPSLPRLLDRGWWRASTGAAHPYIVMEWIRGQTLYEWGGRYNPTSRQVMKVVAQLAWGLEVVHRAPEADIPLFAAEAAAKGAPAATQAPKARPVLVSGRYLPRLRTVRTAFVAATAFALITLCRSGDSPYEPAQEVAWVAAQDEALDGGTRGLGEEVLSTRVDAHAMAAPSASAITQDMPDELLPGQRRPPCPRGSEVGINGGCWKHQPDIKPPCGDPDYYEWRGACYLPVMKRTRVPTTQEP
jgi:hypothetical protein